MKERIKKKNLVRKGNKRRNFKRKETESEKK